MDKVFLVRFSFKQKLWISIYKRYGLTFNIMRVIKN